MLIHSCPPTWEGAVRGSKVTPVLSDTEHSGSQSPSPTPKGKPCLLYPRKLRITQFFHVSPWSGLRKTVHFHLLLTHQRRALLLTGKIIHSLSCSVSARRLLFSISQTQRWRTRLQQSPTPCDSEYLELKLDFTVIDILRKHFGKTSLRTKRKLTPSHLLYSQA